MPTLQAQVPTERASRYLTQFCKHATAMGSGGHRAGVHLQGRMTRGGVRVAANWSDSEGTITFTPWGRCILTADADALTIRVDASDQDGLTQIRDIVTRNLLRFSSRDPLSVIWEEPPAPGGVPVTPVTETTPQPGRDARRVRLQVGLLILVGVLAIGVHVGLAGPLVGHSRWAGIASDLVVAAIVAKLAVVAWTHYRSRRRKVATGTDHN
ncbi:DUF2218 domain-containing protein [Micromonospora sp. CPCC 206061]|uniref:DUF2218 domain-containing protein n=1 Tax=Micromonospora sp. CPCC 206061 TaxID=3122410 RepID=UPI002FF25CB8